MESSEELITTRRAKITGQITGKSNKDDNLQLLLAQDTLLDALQALYEECTIETLQKHDKHIAQFVEKYKSTIRELKKLRINISDFEICNIIGRGHFGEVHLVKEKHTGDTYALKTIRKFESLEKTNFEHERDIMAFSQSPWLTSLQYSFQDTIYLFYVMEFHPGGDLLNLLYRQGGTLPESAVTFYIAELILALEDLHKMGYVHRDIKPDNVLLDRCGHLKLVDFGSAAKLNTMGLVERGPPVGTPDYVAPEVLKSLETKSKATTYGTACDFWSLGVLAYELTVGKPPFTTNSTPATYAKIMNYSNNLKFPPDLLLTQAFVNLLKSLIVADEKNRIKSPQIKQHPVFKTIDFENLRDQVPPYVPKIKSDCDTSNFSDVTKEKTGPSLENFRRKTQFSGRNLPFIGFTYMHDLPTAKDTNYRQSNAQTEIIKSLKGELEEARRSLMKSHDAEDTITVLEKKLLEKSHKLENVESVRVKLERELATKIAENTAFKRALDIERKDRSELERKALDMIKSAKAKWAMDEHKKIESMKLEIEQYHNKIAQLTTTNQMLNEQLQKAFKIEHKHKESLENVEKMNRRSVIGLESRLNKITTETKSTISNLQVNLDDMQSEKAQLEVELAEGRKREQKLLNKLKTTEHNYEELKSKVDEAQKVIRELSSKVNLLQNDLQTSDNCKLEIDQLKRQIDMQQVQLKEWEVRNSLLKTETGAIEGLQNEIVQLKNQKIQNERKIGELESILHETREKNAALKKQIDESENAMNENQELRELRVKFWRMEKELGNCKIDKRILERELKDAQSQIKELSDEIDKLNRTIGDNRKIHETSLLELSNINETLSLELVKIKEHCRGLEGKLAVEKEKFDGEKCIIEELKEIIHDKDGKIADLNGDISLLRGEKQQVLNSYHQLETDKTHLTEELNRLKREHQNILHDLENSKRQAQNAQLNWEALREACTLLENQVIEYEKISESLRLENGKTLANTEKLIGDLCAAKEEIQQARRATNEEKSLRLLAEAQVKRLNDEVECLQSECGSFKEQCLQFKEYSHKLSDELAVAEENVSSLQVNIKSYERQIDDFIGENNALKEEISQYLTQICTLKESNSKLKHQIQDLKNTKTILEEKCDDLEEILNAKIAHYEERDLKYESTIKQQTKLIDFLQIKIDELGQKKKTLADKLFGHSKKENQPPTIQQLNYRDLEMQLQKQKRINKELQEELNKIKPGFGRNKLERHQSEIVASPKRTFETSKPSAKSPLLDSNNARNSNNIITEPVKHEGWIKVLSKNNMWEKRYGCVTESRFLIYSNPPKDKGTVIRSIELSPPNGKGEIILEPLTSEIGVNVEENDLEYVMKLIISSEITQLTLNSIVFMALTIAERDEWFKIFQEQFGGKYDLETVVEIPQDLIVNCIVDLTKNIRILGTKNGLCSIYNNEISHIEGLEEVRHIGILPLINMVVMITGKHGRLIVCDLNHLINLAQCAPCVQPKLTYKDLPVNKSEDFHLLEVSTVKDQAMFCVANWRHLIIVRYDDGINEFVPLRTMDTLEPSRCALFTEHSLIVGADRFFEIDLVTFEADEFLDASDVRLKHVIKCHKIKSFPVAVMQIVTNPKEFLLCFKEFSVFVDEYGRASKLSEIKPTYVPLAFWFIKPFLYVFQFSSVEIFKIDDDVLKVENCERFEKVIVDLNGVKYLGRNKQGIYVYHDKKIKMLDGRNLMDSDVNTSFDSQSTLNSQSDRFSFTSSIVQSLDGHASDEDNVNLAKKVTFSQTNL